MDDNIAQPSFTPNIHNTQENDPDLSEDEDDAPDWTKLKTFAFLSSSKPAIPKRGDKEFEPAQGGPSNLQSYSLNRSRDAMFSALQAERAISNKSISYAIWYPELSRAAMIQIRGVLFNGIGHSVPRPVQLDDGTSKLRKRTELLPEEALYLIERGSLFCWKYNPGMDNTPKLEGSIDTAEEHLRMYGIPMTVQQAYAEMIGRDHLTLEKYHAYAYLKRLGFNVLRTHPPSHHYPIPPPLVHPNIPFLGRIYSSFKGFFANLWKQLFCRVNWWRPVRLGSLLGCAKNYPSFYKSLRFIPSGHRAALFPPSLPSTTSPYKLFYNVYKPITPFRKTAPPAPDFSLVVVDARITPLPTLRELTDLWDQLPETGPPLPRRKNQGKVTKPVAEIKSVPQTPSPSVPVSSSLPSRWPLARFFSWFGFVRYLPVQNALVPNRPPHPFAVLKNGKKTVVIGVVDCGIVSFYRFSSGLFEELPLL